MPTAQADEGRSWTLQPGFTAVQPKAEDTSKQVFDETVTSGDP
ncbi:hypothetical protein [Streptomyces sp. NPDC101178]